MIIRSTILIAAGLFLVGTAGPALSQPQPVPRLTERRLDKASYVELAKQWKQYIEEHGETADALVNLGMAYDYSEEMDAAVVVARRAVEVDPNNPKALRFLGKMLATYVNDQEEALEVLNRCRKVAPDNELGLSLLASVHTRRGELDEADKVMNTIFQQHVIAAPLQDYAYNMLVGLPEGAVLVTGGDNDTYPPLALQAGMEFRTDVVVINRSMLNVPAFAKAIFARHPNIDPGYDIDHHVTTQAQDGKVNLLAATLLKKMIEQKKAPVYFVVSANSEQHGFKPEGVMEGINLRTGPKGLTSEAAGRLVIDTYRMDSVTDWNFAWSLKPSLSLLMRNYVSAMVRLAEQDGVTDATRGRLLDEAYNIADFHDYGRVLSYIKFLQKK